MTQRPKWGSSFLPLPIRTGHLIFVFLNLCSHTHTHHIVCVLKIPQIISGRHCKGQDRWARCFQASWDLAPGIWCRKSQLFPPSATLKLSRLCSYNKEATRAGPYLKGRGWWPTICTISSVKYTILLKFAVQRALITKAQVKMKRFQQPSIVLSLRRSRPWPSFYRQEIGRTEQIPWVCPATDWQNWDSNLAQAQAELHGYSAGSKDKTAPSNVHASLHGKIVPQHITIYLPINQKAKVL